MCSDCICPHFFAFQQDSLRKKGLRKQKNCIVMQVDEFGIPCCDISLSSEELSEKSQHLTSRIPKPPQSQTNFLTASPPRSPLPVQDGVRGANEGTFHKKIHIKRRCSRSSEVSSTASASEDWTVDITQATEVSTSVSGTHDDNSVEETKVSIEKIFFFHLQIAKSFRPSVS